MKIRHTFKTSVNGLRIHKSRSGLTILGIVIGITAIIMVMSVGRGAEEMILSQIRGMGSRTISVEPGRMPQGPADFAEMYLDTVGEPELKALSRKENVPGLINLTPVVVVPGTVSYEGETFRGTVLGVGPGIVDMLDVAPYEGYFFGDDAVKQRAGVAVIGSKIKEELFGEDEAIGKKIKIKNKTLRVIGVVAPKGHVAMLNIDESVSIPYTTAQYYLLGISHFHSIMAQAESEEIIGVVVDDIERIMREMHGITDPDKDDFHVGTQAQAADQVKSIITILTILLGSVAAISLVVGGVGIMNIVLVSVTERTKEIGLRKALGATDNDILLQFLFESVLLTGVGGVIGVVLGMGFSYVIAFILARTVLSGWQFAFSFEAMILGLVVATSVGVIFGLYPARQASKKSPIEALRYE